LVVSGLGQLYNRQPHRTAVAFGVEFVGILTMTLAPPRTFAAFVALAALALVWKIGVVADAAIQARGLKTIPLAAYNRGVVYAACIAGVILLGAALRPYRGIESFTIQNESNFPTLHAGDRVMSYRIAGDAVARGNMVALQLPRDPKIFLVKRIVGLPGERVMMRQGQVLINKVSLRRTETEQGSAPSSIQGRTFVEVTPEGKGYLVLDQMADSTFDTVQEQRVPEDHYWVLGDNRDDSLDSRAMFQVGFVPAQNIYRKVAYVYWSRDRTRIGMAVE
jgi:signal peptidase I